MSVYKLTYFDIRAKAEVARLMFAYQEQSYEDIRIAFKDWSTFKQKMPFGQVPTLEIDGKIYSESVAINNYLAGEFSLYGKDSIQKLEIDQVVGIVQDIWRYIVDWIHENDETGKAALWKENEEKWFPKYLAALEKLLQSNENGFFVGDQLSYADIAVFDVQDIWFQGSLLDKYPLVKAHSGLVKNHDKLKNYIATRKDAPR